MKKRGSLGSLIRILGPGFVSGAADNDPAGIATYTQAGAQSGYGQLWTALFAFPLRSRQIRRRSSSSGVGARTIEQTRSARLKMPVVLALGELFCDASPMSLIKSKKRVADHGEVFTPRWLVEKMLDLVKGETERIDSRFLEPACGSGNFLVPVLQRKLAAVSASPTLRGGTTPCWR
jgi:hypothetical protein